MQLHPTRSTFHVAVAAVGFITLGTAARLAPVVAFGGAMLIAIAIGRAVAIVGVTRLRRAGFEMIWTGGERVIRASRGAPLVITCDLINRSSEAVRVTGLHAVAASTLVTSVEPAHADLGPGTRSRFAVTLQGARVGRWGVHGVGLQVSATPLGAEGLFDVPLLFANPLGIEVLPPDMASFLASARGGRARRASETGQRGRGPGHGDEVRELRDHAQGDPLKRVAWKASARRGRLLVRELERDESDVVWLVVDASIELWAGAPGSAPLDAVIDDVAALAARLLRQGDSVGLVVTASRLRSWVVPSVGAAQGAIIAGALASASSAVDADRSGLLEADVARLVAEHARPFESRTRADVPRRSLDSLAAHAERLRPRAPFESRLPFAPTARERTLRHYLSSFGIESPPRPSGEREKAESTLARTLEKIALERPRASVVHVWAPAPRFPAAMAKAVAAVRRRRIELRWTLPPYDVVLDAATKHGGTAGLVAREVAGMKAASARARGEHVLRRLGVRVVARRARQRRASPAVPARAPA